MKFGWQEVRSSTVKYQVKNLTNKIHCIWHSVLWRTSYKWGWRVDVVLLWLHYGKNAGTWSAQLGFVLREAQAQGWDTQLDNRKGTWTFPVSKVVSYRQCLDLHCISIRIETLKNRAALKHTSSSEQSKSWCLKTPFKALKPLTSRTINSTTFKTDFLSSRSICQTPAIIFETVWNTMLLHAQLIVSVYPIKKMSSL